MKCQHQGADFRKWTVFEHYSLEVWHHQGSVRWLLLPHIYNNPEGHRNTQAALRHTVDQSGEADSHTDRYPSCIWKGGKCRIQNNLKLKKIKVLKYLCTKLIHTPDQYMVYTQSYTTDTSLLLTRHFNFRHNWDSPVTGCSTEITVTGSATSQIITQSPEFRLYTHTQAHEHLTWADNDPNLYNTNMLNVFILNL